MEVHVRIRVKFRAFGITYKTEDRQWRFDGAGLHPEPVNVPESARVLFDKLGVKVNVW